MSNDPHLLWARMELALPTKVVKAKPRVYVVNDRDYERLPPLPKGPDGLYYYGGIPVLSARDVFFVDEAIFKDVP